MMSDDSYHFPSLQCPCLIGRGWEPPRIQAALGLNWYGIQASFFTSYSEECITYTDLNTNTLSYPNLKTHSLVFNYYRYRV